jgi:hypothetical protein
LKRLNLALYCYLFLFQGLFKQISNILNNISVNLHLVQFVLFMQNSIYRL